MKNKHTKLPDPIAETMEEVADRLGKNDSMIIREYVEEGLEEDGYLDHLEEDVRESLKADGGEDESDE